RRTQRRFIEAEQFQPGLLVFLFRPGLTVEKTLELVGLQSLVTEKDAMHVFDLLGPRVPGRSVGRGGCVINEGHATLQKGVLRTPAMLRPVFAIEFEAGSA